MDETLEASNATIGDEVEHNAIEPASKQSTTSNEATSKDTGELDVIIIYSTILGLAPLNYGQPTIVIGEQVLVMIGKVMETFAE